MSYIAHIRIEDKEEQSVKDHLLGVMKIAELHGSKIGIKHLAGLAGLLHDLGKVSSEFKDYIISAVYTPESAPSRGSVDHSTAGGKLLYKLFHNKNNQIEALMSEI